MLRHFVNSCPDAQELVGHLLRLTECSWSGPHPEEDVRVSSEPERSCAGPMLFMALGNGKETVGGEDFWQRMGGDDISREQAV